MKIRKSISAILLSVLLCISMLTTPVAFAADEVTVTVSGGSQINFDANITEYDVTVPVWYASGVDSYTYEMPVITVDNAGTAVEVTMPAALPGDAAFTISETDYTIHLGLASNMYENGGVEKSSHKFARTDSGGVERTSESAFTGTYSVKKRAASYTYGVIYNEAKTLVKGKTYLSSYATRQAVYETEPEQPFRAADVVEAKNSTETATVKFYRDGALVKASSEPAQKHSVSSFNLTNNWNLMQAVITPTTETYTLNNASSSAQAGHFHREASSRQVATLWDDFFLGELAVGKIDVTDDNGNSASTVIPGTTDAKTLTLNGTLLNQLGNTVGFEDKTLTWTCKGNAEGITVDDGVVTIPANQAVGEYIITATADLTDINNIGKVSTSYVLTVGDVQSSDLATLTVTGSGLDLSECKLNSATTTYTVGVPVRYAEGVDSYTYTMPEISATPVNSTHQVVVTPAEALPGTAIIDVKDGEEVLKTYSVNLVALGANRYENGGVEKDNDQFWRSDTGPTEQVKDVAYTGEYSLWKREASFGVGVISNKVHTLTKGKSYLSSYATRQAVYEEQPAQPFRAVDVVESTNSTQTATVNFYRDGALVKASSEPAQNHAVNSFNLTNTWNLMQAVITPTTETYDIGYQNAGHFHREASARQVATLWDDFFLGELIVGGVQLNDAYGEKLPTTISTEQAHTLNLSASAVNQLGTIAGLEGKTELSAITAVGEMPAGVTYENGELTIAQGATGTVTLSVTATPIGGWTNQEAFTEIIEITLIDGSFRYVKGENGKVTCVLSYYTCNSYLDAILYNAVYTKSEDNVYKLESVVEEEVEGYNDQFIYRETVLTIEPGQVIKSFLWYNDGSLEPCAVSGVYGE